VASLIEPVRVSAISLDELRSRELDSARLCRDMCVEGIVLANSPTPDDRLHKMQEQLECLNKADMRVEINQMIKDVSLLSCGLERRYGR